MDFGNLPLFSDLLPDQRSAVLALGRSCSLARGDVLFYEGDPADELSLLVSGRMALTHAAAPDGTAIPGQFLDMTASLGGLAHTIKATADQACEVLTWTLSDLLRIPEFEAAARRTLGRSLRQAETRLAEIEAPIHYVDGARIANGPFAFKNTTLLIAFCEADREAVSATLPHGLSLLAGPAQPRAPIFVGLADFPDAHPEHNPQARFSYTETSFFVPVRCGVNPGVFIPYIYPSSWEPILIGREIYGFPKRLGYTDIGPNGAGLSVDGEMQFRLGWRGLEASDENRLVGALMSWLGIERHVASAAFRAGDVLRIAMGLPAHRRVDVYNRKQILSAAATDDAPNFAVDSLTHAVFGVVGWFGISRMKDPILTISSGPMVGANLVLREAYRTQLDMRLSIGEVIEGQ